MAFYRVCEICGANLDPGERCDCEERREEERRYIMKMTRQHPVTGQIEFVWEDTYEKKVAV